MLHHGGECGEGGSDLGGGVPRRREDGGVGGEGQGEWALDSTLELSGWCRTPRASPGSLTASKSFPKCLKSPLLVGRPILSIFRWLAGAEYVLVVVALTAAATQLHSQAKAVAVLHPIMEKAVVLIRATGTRATSPSLAEVINEYATLLVAQGQLATALKYTSREREREREGEGERVEHIARCKGIRRRRHSHPVHPAPAAQQSLRPSLFSPFTRYEGA